MSDKKIIATLFLIVSSFIYGACSTLNLTQGSRVEAANTNRAKERRTDSAKDSTFEKQNISSEPETVPTPPRKSAADNFVCAEPNLPCHHKQKQFDDWELSFRMPAKLIPNKIYKSAPFYAVILKKYDEGCDDLDSNPKVEHERQQIQKLFSSRKVFAEYSCPDMDGVTYDFDGKFDGAHEQVLYMDYIAVYAGVTEAEGKEIYALLKKDYPQAELKKMIAEYSQVDQ